MGQVSLPRLNRVGVGMWWEFGIDIIHKYGLSLKFYIFLRFFLKYFYLYNLVSFWYTKVVYTSYKYIINFYRKNQEKVLLINNKHMFFKKKIINFYSYFIEGVAYIAVINFNVKTVSKKKGDRWILKNTTKHPELFLFI